MRRMITGKQAEQIEKNKQIAENSVQLTGDQTIAGDKKFADEIKTNFITGFRDTGAVYNKLSIASGSDQVSEITVGSDNTTGGSASMSAMNADGDYNYGKIDISNQGINIHAENAEANVVGKIRVSDNGVNIASDGEEFGSINLSHTDNIGGTALLSTMDSDGNVVGQIQVSSDGVTINGDVDGTGSGYIYMSGLPTSDPKVEGALWNDNGTLKISAGE